MANEFYIKIEDNDGAVPNASFYAYPTAAAAVADSTWVGTGKATLSESQPVTSDANGEAVIHHATYEELFIKAVGSTSVVGIRCSNTPTYDIYTAGVPATGDLFIFADSSDSYAIKSITYDNLVTALTAAVIASGGLMTGVGTTKVTLSASAASGGADGDIWIQRP